jgi:hypothetical protein
VPRASLSRLVLAGLLAISLAACAQQTRVTSQWYGERSGLPADRVLVVSMSQDLNIRRSFEDMVVDRLAGTGNTSWASSREMDTSAPVDRESLTKVVQATGANLVTVTRLVDQEIQVGKAGEAAGVRVQRKDQTPLDFFRYDYEFFEDPQYLVPERAVSLQTDVFHGGNGTLLYRIETVIPPRETRFEISNEAAKAIVARLRRDGLVR